MKERKFLSVFVCLLMVATVFVVAVPVNVSAEPVYVEVDNDFDSSTPGWGVDHFDNIQDGVNAVDVGGTVFVYAGIYYEQVVISRTITLEGEDKETTIIQGSGIGNGIYISIGRSGVIIKNLNINNFECGIYMHAYCTNNIISGNIIYNNNDGIYVYSSMFITIKENTVYDNYCGIYLLVGGVHTIKENTILNNYYGIRLRSSMNTISWNTVSNNYFGIWMGSYFAWNTISENTISNNYYGIRLYRSYTILIFHNNFIENEVQAKDNGINTWDDSDGNGNYWSDYEGEDLNDDGIGDTLLPHQYVDWYPLMEPWGPKYMIREIIEDIEEMELPKGVEDALVSILEAAINSLENDNENAAIQQLEAFINLVEAFRGTKLTDEQADALIASAQEVIESLS